MPQEHAAVFPKHIFASIAGHRTKIGVSPILIESASMDEARIFERFATRSEGLTAEVVKTRLAEHGPNVLAKDQRPSLAKILWRAVLNPLVVLLAILASVSFMTGDVRAGGMMCLMLILGVGLKLIQEAKADSAAAKLKAMISVTATVIRDGVSGEILVSQLVPGDVVMLAAGDMIPADVRMLVAKDRVISRIYSVACTLLAIARFDLDLLPRLDSIDQNVVTAKRVALSSSKCDTSNKELQSPVSHPHGPLQVESTLIVVRVNSRRIQAVQTTRDNRNSCIETCRWVSASLRRASSQSRTTSWAVQPTNG